MFFSSFLAGITTLTVGAGRTGLPFRMSPGDRRVTAEVDVDRRTGLGSTAFNSRSPEMTLSTSALELEVPLSTADFGSRVVIWP